MIEKNIKKYIKKNLGKRNVYIETGFKNGDSLRSALQFSFDKLYTIEFYQKYFDEEINFLTSYSKRVIPITGDSGLQLDKLLKEISIKKELSACVYLDAHGHNSKISPLINELNALKNNNRKNDLIIIDDFFFIENALNNRNRAPWATEIIDAGWDVNKIYNLLREINGKDAIIEKIPYYPGPLYKTIFNRYSPFSVDGKNYHLCSRCKD